MRHRLAIILPIYCVLFTSTLLLATLLRYEFRMTAANWDVLLQSLPVFLGTKLFVCAVMREWDRTYRHSSIHDVLVTATCCTASTFILLALFNRDAQLSLISPRSIILIDYLCSLIAISWLRLSCRVMWNYSQRNLQGIPTEAALIYGNNETAIAIWKMLTSSNGQVERYRVVGFIDPSPDKQRSLIGGQPVYSVAECWARAEELNIQHILVPTTTPGRTVRDLLYQAQQVDINVHKIPTVEEIVDGRFRLAVRDLDIDDLLRRPPTQLDLEGIGQLIRGKSVLVTGGAGSIGSELCRQITSYQPKQLILFDHSEFGIFQMEREFAQQKLSGIEVVYVTASLLDADAVEDVFAQYQPQVVFHAAAYKHVPLMEDNPYAAVKNNILGTKAVVDAAHRHQVERFVLISTDKAVRPTSVMGATKLMAEKYLQAMAQASKTKFITVRFGNVLNSVGSVVPTFRAQIERGGPITVTHPDMVRYFMTIPEAVQLVLQAGTIGRSGNVLILDMGEPVRIVDLAKDMITLSGLSYPDDIDIEFTGLRPGEKMYEELFYEHEQEAEKLHEKIILGSGYAPPLPQIQKELQSLNETLRTRREQVAPVLWKYVERYVALDDRGSETHSLPAAA